MVTKNKNESVYFFDVNTSLIDKEEKTVKQQGQEIKMTTKLFDYKSIHAHHRSLLHRQLLILH